MPQAAPKPCITCKVLVPEGTSRCAAHKPAPWLARPEVKRTAGRKLQQQRAALFSAEPFCRACKGNGLRVLAEIRDHIKPLAEGGTDEPANIQPLCKPCHDAKTAGESAKGRGVQMSAALPTETDLEVKFSRAGVVEGGVPFWQRTGGNA